MSKKSKKTKVKKQVSSKKSIPAKSKNFDLGIDSKYIAWGALGVILLMAIIIRSNFLDISFERDEGTYSYMGQLLLDGKVPYKDFYTMKLPGIYYAYAFLIAIFGASVKGLHIGFLLVNMTSIFMLYLLGKRLFGQLGGIATAAAFGLMSLAPGLSGFTCQSEHLVAFFLIAGALLVSTALEKQKAWWFILAGVVMCLTFSIKQNGVFFILFGGLYIVLHHLLSGNIKEQIKPIIRNGLLYSAGVFGLYGLLCAIMAMQGAFSDFWYFTFEYPRAYSSAIPWDVGIGFLKTNLGKVSDGYMPFWIMAILGLLLVFLAKNEKKTTVFVVLLAVLCFLSVWPGMRFYGHYWLHFLPGWALAVGGAFYGLQKLAERLNISSSLATVALSGILAVLCVANIAGNSKYYFNPDHTSVLRDVYGFNPFPEAREVGEYIRKNTQEGDQIAVMGSEPQIHFYADRRAPSRHCYYSHLVSGSEKHAQWQQELINDVTQARPKYIVFLNHKISWLSQTGAEKGIFTWAEQFLRDNYVLDGVVDMVQRGDIRYAWGTDALSYRPAQNKANPNDNIIRVYKLR